jgi:putative nucleotidyltransferase with HDIG domain
VTATVFETLRVSTTAFLRHSIACAVAMRAMADSGQTRLTGLANGEEAFVHGLLHDVGKIVLEQYLPDLWRKAGALAQAERMPWYVAERAVIGVDHAEVGARLAELWKLAPDLAGAIGGHHDLERAGSEAARVLAAGLAVADFLCAASGAPSHENPVFDLPDEVWSCVGLAADAVPAVAGAFFSNYHVTGELMPLAG